MEVDNIEAVIKAAREGVKPHLVEKNNGRAIYFVGSGANGNGQFYTVSAEEGYAVPMRKRGTVTVFDAASFNQVIADNADAGDIAIYFDRNPEKPAVVAVLNGSGPNGPGWADYRVQISFRPTPQWLKWKAIDGKLLPQANFAEFVEDNLEDISDPAGGAMLEIVTYLQATRTVSFKSGIKLSSGQIQFQNLEDIEAKVGAGSIAVPETFTLGIAPIFGLASYAVPARFRYRIQDGKLQMGFKLQRVETMMGQIIEDVIAKIERGANISVMDGLPPEPLKAV